METPNHIKVIDKRDPLLGHIHDLIAENFDVLDYVFRKSIEQQDLVIYEKLCIQFRNKLKKVETLVKEGLLLDPGSYQNRTGLTFVGLMYTSVIPDVFDVFSRMFTLLKEIYINSDGEQKLSFEDFVNKLYRTSKKECSRELYFLCLCTETAPFRFFDFSKNISKPSDGPEIVQINWVKASREILEYDGFDRYLYAVRDNYVQRRMRAAEGTPRLLDKIINFPSGNNIPSSIAESLQQFRRDYPNPSKVAFVMMEFNKKPEVSVILKSIKDVLAERKITAVRADEKQYHDDLIWNVMTYLYGCAFGIAVYEKIKSETFNPNISLEVGALFALNKSVCILKDNNLKEVPTDIIGKLYRPFQVDDLDGTLKNELSGWLHDKNF